MVLVISREIGCGPLTPAAEVVSDSIQLCMSAVIMGLIRQRGVLCGNVETHASAQVVLILSFE